MPEETFSDSDSSFEPAKAVPRKRKSAGGTANPKRVKTAVGGSSSTGVLNKANSQLASLVLANGVEFYEEEQADAADAVVKLAVYVKELEAALAEAKSSEGVPAKRKTRAELEAAADKIAKAAVSGIKKQMSWKPSCKTNSAKWSYDGLCTDAEVFGILLGLDGPVTWKMKKFTKEEFENALGSIEASVRYDTLCITGNVNVRYNSDSSEFKFSGTYGRGY